MAKIHIVEWTPAVISDPTTQWAVKINCWVWRFFELERGALRLVS